MPNSLKFVTNAIIVLVLLQFYRELVITLVPIAIYVILLRSVYFFVPRCGTRAFRPTRVFGRISRVVRAARSAFYMARSAFEMAPPVFSSKTRLDTFQTPKKESPVPLKHKLLYRRNLGQEIQ